LSQTNATIAPNSDRGNTELLEESSYRSYGMSYILILTQEQDSAHPAGGQEKQALSRTKGELNTKLHVAVDKPTSHSH
jgi:hypothetical protein